MSQEFRNVYHVFIYIHNNIHIELVAFRKQLAPNAISYKFGTGA